MKYLIGIFLALYTSLCFGIQVIGEGRTIAEAKQNAFASAIQTYVGSLVLSEREAKNYQLVKNEIFVYSAGYIKGYKVLQTFNTNIGYRLVLDVEVESSKLSDRIVGKSKDSKVFEGEKHHTQIESLLNEKQKGDVLLKKILSGYPVQAFIIESEPQFITLSGNRDLHINIPYTLSWNSNFIKALSEVLNVLEDGNSRLFGNNNLVVTIQSKDIGNYLTGQNHYRFKDNIRFHTIKNIIGNNTFKIRTNIKSKFNEETAFFCGVPIFYQGLGSFYSIGDPSFTKIYGNHKEKGTLQIKLDYQSDLYNRFKDFSSIELQIVPEGTC